MNTINKNEIKATVATINNFPPQEDSTTQNTVVYFCESHNKSIYERDYIRSTTDFMHRYEADLTKYEKYELRTGYLSRWNYMPKDIDEMSLEEIDQSIKKGYEEENEWLQRCEPDLPKFIPKDWKDCISQKENPYYQQCKEFIMQELDNNKIFYESFEKSVITYSKKHKSNRNNGWKYVLEEVVWVFSLPLVHPSKYICLIHVGKANPAIKELFNIFPNFNKTVKWLRPHIWQATFKNNVDFLMYYNANRNIGCSYAIDNRSIVNHFTRTTINKNDLSLEFQSIEKTLLQSIIEKVPCHVYWLNRDNVYLGCNEMQAESAGLQSRDEIIGKTNFDFHDSNTAKELNNINELVMSTGKSYEVEESGFFLGQRKDCLSKKIPLFDTLGKVVGLLGISFDITKKKRIEELESKLKIDEVLSKVVQEVAHDIASPVSSLKIIEEVYDGKLSEQDGRMLKSAILSIEGMTGKILSNYRISKNLEIEKKTAVDKVEEKNMCPYVILPDIVENMRYRNRQANIEIKYESDNGNNFEFIKGDDADFGRMMVNLIKNAQEAIAEERKGIIEIFLSKKENNIEIRVKDNGKGISKEMAQKLEKGEGIGTTKEEKGGHGIGTQQIINTIKAMNGKIKIETKEKEGTEFILTFPKIQKS